jgi:hypothetical protein
MTDIACALCGTKLQPETKGWVCDPCRKADESWANSLNFSPDNRNIIERAIDPYNDARSNDACEPWNDARDETP